MHVTLIPEPLTGTPYLPAGSSQPHPAALQQVPEHWLMETACRPARRREALLAAAHIRECDAGTAWMVSVAPVMHTALQTFCSSLYAAK